MSTRHLKSEVVIPAINTAKLLGFHGGADQGPTFRLRGKHVCGGALYEAQNPGNYVECLKCAAWSSTASGRRQLKFL
jgi:hypothetical protein